MPETTPKPVTKNNQPMLKMKQLSEATGVAKSTILLYVKKGLLPAPVKTSPNMAYYHPICIDRVTFIKKIQSSHRLPLAAIKGLINEMDKGEDVSSLLELQSMLFGSKMEKLNRTELCRESGLSTSQLEFLCTRDLISPIENNTFDDKDLAVAKLFKICFNLNVNPDDLGFYPKFANEIVENEIRIREQYTKNLSFKENASLTLELTQLARGLRAYFIDRALQNQLIGFKGLKKIKTEAL
jgi:DNA-binding transcriptional MerR regulator